MMTSSNGNICRVTGLCAGNSPVTGVFPALRPVTRGFYVFFDLRLYQQLSKQWRRWWFETPSRSLWRLGNAEIQSRFELVSSSLMWKPEIVWMPCLTATISCAESYFLPIVSNPVLCYQLMNSKNRCVVAIIFIDPRLSSSVIEQNKWVNTCEKPST